MKPNQNNKTERISVPCGKCIACQSNRRSDWSIRLLEERKNWDNAIFLTLTYNDDNVKDLNKRDIQLFFKVLRKYKDIKYYLVGEYGTRTKRPHYHAIIFGLNRDDSSRIEKVWGKGNIMVGTVNMASIMYVAKYHVNRKVETNEFALMSKNMGIKYVESMAMFHEGKIENAFYPYYDKKMRLPRYYKEKLYSKSEREKIGQIWAKDEYSIEEIREYEMKYPNSNFFKMKLDSKLNEEQNFKNKSNLNNKL